MGKLGLGTCRRAHCIRYNAGRGLEAPQQGASARARRTNTDSYKIIIVQCTFHPVPNVDESVRDVRVPEGLGLKSACALCVAQGSTARVEALASKHALRWPLQ